MSIITNKRRDKVQLITTENLAPNQVPDSNRYFKALNKKTGEKELCYIQITGKEEQRRFRAYRKSDKKELGFAIIKPYRVWDGHFGNPSDHRHWPPFIPVFRPQHKYGNEPKIEKIRLLKLENLDRENYALIGTSLIREIQKMDFGGRIDLWASHSSLPFYYKLGFRALEAHTNQNIKKAIKEHTTIQNKNPVYMYLPT